MQWPLAHIHHILRWAESGLLRAQQIQQLATLAPLEPSRADWLATGERLCLWGGALLLALAVVFFFAYNWADLHHFAKLAVAAAALLACVATALASPPTGTVWQAALFSAALCTGALLALIGQIYQTGADIWELFAAWSALMLPFVLLARAWPAWLLCVCISNVCLMRLWYAGGLLYWGPDDDARSLALILTLNSAWWLLAARCKAWMLVQPGPTVERVAGAFALVTATCGAVVGVWDAEDFGVYVPLFLAMAGGTLWWYRSLRLDVVMLAVMACCAITVGGGLLSRILFDNRGDWFLGMFLMAAYVLTASGVTLSWLRDLYRQQHQEVRA